MADAQASGACSRKAVWVQVPSPAWNTLQTFSLQSIFYFRFESDTRTHTQIPRSYRNTRTFLYQTEKKKKQAGENN